MARVVNNPAEVRDELRRLNWDVGLLRPYVYKDKYWTTSFDMKIQPTSVAPLLRKETFILYDTIVAKIVRKYTPLLSSIWGFGYTVNNRCADFVYGELDLTNDRSELPFTCIPVRLPNVQCIEQTARQVAKQLEADAVGLPYRGRWPRGDVGLFRKPGPSDGAWCSIPKFIAFYKEARRKLADSGRRGPYTAVLPHAWSSRRSWCRRGVSERLKTELGDLYKAVFVKHDFNQLDGPAAVFQCEWPYAGIVHRLTPTLIQFDRRLYVVSELLPRFDPKAVATT